jgi:hypothetical protein
MSTSTEKYSVLINEDRIRATLKRMFSNSLGEVFGELLQNSQRAGATKVTITNNDDAENFGFVYQDNGHGLVHGVDSLHTLLKLADSHFEDARVADQHPMGLGFHSLLAWNQVVSVVIESGDLSLGIDAKAWWEDPEHYKLWHERLVTLDEPVKGLRLRVFTTNSVAASLEFAFPSTLDGVQGSSVTQHPAIGYSGILEVELDNVPVLTTPPASKGYVPEPILETTFKGNRLLVGIPPGRNGLEDRSLVNWYGQLVDASAPVAGFKFYLEVREGRPVNPKTPSRAGLIEDDALAELTAFVRDQLFAWAANPENAETVTPRIVRKLYHLDYDRAVRSCPYFVAKRVRELNPDGYSSFNEYDGPAEGDKDYGLVLLRFDDPTRVLVRSGIEVNWPYGVNPTYYTYRYGMESFLSALGHEGYICDSYEVSRMLGDRVLQLSWFPEVAEGTSVKDVVVLAGPGRYRLAPVGSYNEPVDFPADVTNVFAFCDNSYATLNGVAFAGYAQDPVDMLERYGMAMRLDAQDDNDRRAYTNQLDTVIRGLLGDSVRVAFTTEDLLALFKNDVEGPAAAIAGVKYHYPKKGETAKATHITASTTDGRARKVRLYGA